MYDPRFIKLSLLTVGGEDSVFVSALLHETIKKSTMIEMVKHNKKIFLILKLIYSLAAAR